MTGLGLPSVTALLSALPSPSRSGFSLGPFDLRLYGLMIALGVVAAVWLFGTRDHAGSIAVWGVVAGVLGARAYHVVTDWSRFSDDLGLRALGEPRVVGFVYWGLATFRS